MNRSLVWDYSGLGLSDEDVDLLTGMGVSSEQFLLQKDVITGVLNTVKGSTRPHRQSLQDYIESRMASLPVRSVDISIKLENPFDTYTIVSTLGQGTFGTVYEALGALTVIATAATATGATTPSRSTSRPRTLARSSTRSASNAAPPTPTS